MSGLTIRLFNPNDALLSPTSPELEERTAPFTYSPLDSCRGGKVRVSQKSRYPVRDVSKKDTQSKKAVCLH
jgi:hypothetical protein